MEGNYCLLSLKQANCLARSHCWTARSEPQTQPQIPQAFSQFWTGMRFCLFLSEIPPYGQGSLRSYVTGYAIPTCNWLRSLCCGCLRALLGQFCASRAAILAWPTRTDTSTFSSLSKTLPIWWARRENPSTNALAYGSVK